MRVSKRGLWIGAAAAAATAAWLFWPSGEGYVANAPPSNPTLVMLGDSMTSGVGASAGQELPAQLGRLLGREVVNRGAPGETTADALKRLEAIVALRPGTVVIFLGGNDRLQKRPIAETESDLGRIVERLQAAGAMVALVGFQGTPWDGYGSMFKRVARKHGCVLVPDALEGILFSPQMKFDPIHPNDKGYALIAQRIAKRLGPHLQAGG